MCDGCGAYRESEEGAEKGQEKIEQKGRKGPVALKSTSSNVPTLITRRDINPSRLLRCPEEMAMAHGCPGPMGAAKSCLPTGSNGPVRHLGNQLRPRATTRRACAAASCAPQKSKMRMREAHVRAARHLRYPTGRRGTSEEATLVRRTITAQMAQSPWRCWTRWTPRYLYELEAMRGGGVEWGIVGHRLAASCSYHQ